MSASARRQLQEFQAAIQREQQRRASDNATYSMPAARRALVIDSANADTRADKVRQHLEYRRHLERISAKGNTSKLDLRGKGRRPHVRVKEGGHEG